MMWEWHQKLTVRLQDDVRVLVEEETRDREYSGSFWEPSTYLT